MKHLGPHSRPGKLAVIDGRSAEARRMKEVRQELAQHVGGSPSIAQRMLIDRIAALTLRMELMDRKAMQSDGLTEKDTREYLGWNNTVSRMLRQLGLHGTPQRAPTLAEALAASAARSAA